MCFKTPKPPPIPPPLPLPPAPKPPPAPRSPVKAPQPLGNPDEQVGIDTPKSKSDNLGTTSQGTNQLKIKLNTGTNPNNTGINI